MLRGRFKFKNFSFNRLAASTRPQRRPRRLEAVPLAQATEWLERYRQFWEGSFQRLDDLLDEMKTREKKRVRMKRTGR
jgi:hypothetical protein